jgi:hypothetical protein
MIPDYGFRLILSLVIPILLYTTFRHVSAFEVRVTVYACTMRSITNTARLGDLHRQTNHGFTKILRNLPVVIRTQQGEIQTIIYLCQYFWVVEVGNLSMKLATFCTARTQENLLLGR